VDELEWIKQKKLREIMDRMKADDSKDDWPDKPLEVTDASFEEVIQRYPVVVVDCWAAWCGPCHMVAPVVDELARDYRGKIVFAKLDVDSNAATAMRYGISSIPTLLVLKNGQLVGRIIGAMPRPSLESQIVRYL